MARVNKSSDDKPIYTHAAHLNLDAAKSRLNQTMPLRKVTIFNHRSTYYEDEIKRTKEKT